MKKFLPILLFLSFAGCVRAQSGYHSYGWKRLISAPYTLTDFTDTLGIVLDTNAFGGQVDTLRTPWDTNTYLFYDGHHHLKWVPITGGSGISQIYGRYPIQIYGTDTVAWNPNLLTKVTISPATDDTPLVIHANNSVGEIPIFTAWSSGGSPTKLFQIGDDGELYFAPTGGLIDGSGSAGSAGQVLESQGSATLTPLWTTLSINNSIYADTVLNNTLTFYDTIQAGEHDNFRHTTNNIYYYATTDASSVLTGIDTSLQNGYFLCIQNQSQRPNGIIVLDNENTASKPQNRIMTGIGKDLVIARFENALLVYVPKYDTDAGGVGDTVGRWVVVGGTAYERNSTGNTNYIYNQFSSAQTSSNFWIDGTGQVGSLNVAPGASNSEGTITTTTTLPLSSFLYKLPYHGGTFIVGDTGAGILTVTAPLKITNADGVTTISDTATGGDSVRASHIADTAKVAHYADTAKSAYTATNLLGTVAQSISLATGTCGTGGTGATPAITVSTSTAGTVSQRISASPGIWQTEQWMPFSTSAAVSFGTFAGIFNAATLSNCAGSSASNYNPAWHLQVYGSGFYGSAARDLMVVMPYNSLGSYGVLAFPNDGGYGIGSIVGPAGAAFSFSDDNTSVSVTGATTGTNIAGGSITETIARGTGTGTPGSWTAKVSYKNASSGTAAQTQRNGVVISANGTDATNSAVTTLTVGSSLITGVGGFIIVPDTVEANNTTGGITIPGASDVKITHGTETAAFKITLPSGTEGQQLTITNTTSYAAGFASGTGVIVAGETKYYEYLNGAWQDLNALTMRPQSFVSPDVDLTAVVGTTWNFLTPSGGTLAFPTAGFTQFLPTDIVILCTSVTGPPTGQGLEVGDGTVPGGVLPSASAIIPTIATQEIIQPIPARAAGGSIYGAGVTPLITSTGQAIGGTLHVRVFMTGIYY